MNNLSKHLFKFALVGVVLLGFLSISQYIPKYYSTNNDSAIDENLTQIEETKIQDTLTDEQPEDNQIVESVSYEVQLDDSNAFELLKENAEIEYKEYDFGVFVESINGTAGDDKHFWALYVNDEQSMTGADQTTVNTGDVLEWKYEEIK